MNIVVCIKAVSQQFDSLRISDGGGGLALEGKSWVMNESDEHALEQGLLYMRPNKYAHDASFDVQIT